MFNIGAPELLLILVVALIVVGPRRLPELGRSLGKGLREIRRAQDEMRKTVQVNLEDTDRPTFPRTPHPAPADRRDADEPAVSGTDAAAAAASTAGAAPSAVSDVSRTLGRGLAELRRAREEIERSFRVELDRPATPARSPERRPPARDPDATDEPGGVDPGPVTE
jgi:Tat protein translocase TatB subunit